MGSTRKLLLAALASAAGMSLVQAAAEPTCYFMECEQGQPNATPARPSPVEPTTEPEYLPYDPNSDADPRPRRQGEVCQRAGAYTYCGSSVLAPQFGFNYVPANMVDNRLDTAWVEGKKGNGEGEWIVVDLERARSVTAIELLNGYHKNADIFAKNNRVREIKITMSNGYSTTVELEDSGGVQKIALDEPQAVTWVQLTIQSVYRGTKYQDTALSEVRVITGR